MVKVLDILAALREFAPVERKMDFDNVGLLAGFTQHQVGKILVSLDITDDVISEAIEQRAELLVSHHPLFFSINSVTDADRTGQKLVRLLSNGMSAICMHTNLDAAEGGVNDALAEAAGLTDIGLLTEEGRDGAGMPFSCGRVGSLTESMQLHDYLLWLKNRLKSNGLRYHDAGLPVRRVAVVGGSGGSYLKYALAQGCDTLITADIKYDVFLEAKEMNINLVDADHFCTENVVTPVLARRLAESFPEIDISVSKRHGQTVKFI
jgi:dinuclear metal center YbgI/SA1388 family protein